MQLFQEALLVLAPPPKPPFADPQHLLGELLHGGPLPCPAGALHLQTVPRDVLLHVEPVHRGPRRDQVLRLLQGLVVVQEPDPEGREGADHVPRAAVRPPHLQKSLQPDLREDGGQVVLPVLHRCHLARKRAQVSLHEVPKGLARHVHVPTVSVHKVHGHRQGVVDILLKPKPILKDPGQVAAPVRVDVVPNPPPVGLVSVELALLDGRVGEERRCDRLQREGDPRFPYHVRLGRVVQVDLYGAAPEHHVVAKGSPGRHVGLHDVVPCLGHHRALLERRGRVETEAEKNDSLLSRNGLHLVQVALGLRASLRQGPERGTAQLQLPAGLEGDALAVELCPYDILPFHDWRP